MADSPGFEETALNRILGEVDAMADAAAVMMGMPPGGKKYSEQEQLTMWNASPIGSPQERVTAMLELKAFGKTDEEITDAIYPERRKAIDSLPGVEAKIRYAKDMDRLMEKRAAEAGMPPPDQGPGPQAQPSLGPGAELTPAPTMAPPPPVPEPPAPASPSPLDMPISSFMGG